MIATARAEAAPALQRSLRALTVGVRAEWRELLAVALIVAAVATANLISKCRWCTQSNIIFAQQRVWDTYNAAS